MKPVSEQTFFITGATDGLGKMMAGRLAKQGARVILHGRNPEKGQAVLAELTQTTGNPNLTYFNADFSALQNVLDLSSAVMAKIEQLDVLINNAAIGGGPKSSPIRELSPDGFELKFAINYLAQVLLTQKLLPLLTQAGSRIINVASIGQTPMDFANLMLDTEYEGYRAYRQSKLALIMYSFDLAESLKAKKVDVNALHPASLMNTNMVMENFGRVITTVEEGCDALEYLATDARLEGVTGKYFEGKKEAKALPQAYDEEARRKLREVTTKMLAQAVQS